MVYEKSKIKNIVLEFIEELNRRKIPVKQVILFGSYAYGKPRPSSDVDLLVVIETNLTPREQRLAISRALSPKPFGIDIIARTPADLELRIAQGDYFLRDIVRKGKVIYERRRRRVG